MTTGIVLDPRFMEHDPGPGHPERPECIAVLLPDLLDGPGQKTKVHDRADWLLHQVDHLAHSRGQR